MSSGVEILSNNILSATEGLAEPSIEYSDPCRNRWGAIKLKLVRGQYGLNVNSDTIPDLINLYRDWRDTVELIPMRLTHKKVGVMDLRDTASCAEKWISEYNSVNPGLLAVPLTDHPNCQIVSYEHFVKSWVNKKSVKRGNDVYTDLLNEKFAPLFKSTKHKEFFSTALNSKRKRTRRTRMLYLTGTCDQSIVGDIVAAWGSFGAYWNHFITCLRNHFGKCAYIRTWQSQKNGYPHYHALVYFFNYQFTVVYRASDKSWRIHNRQSVVINKRTGEKAPCINTIVDLWQWGGLEVKCCNDSKQALRDLLKYVLRDLEGGESDLTNTMVWYFYKKSFAVSQSRKKCTHCGKIYSDNTIQCTCGSIEFKTIMLGFFELFGASDGAFDEPSNADLIDAVGVTQEATQKDTLVSIDIFPLLPRDLMPLLQQLRLDNVEDPPDPPPEVAKFLDLFADLCAPASVLTRPDGVVVTVYKYADQVF